MRRKARLLGVSGFAALLFVALGGCGLTEDECLGVRSEAFDIINGSHTCNDDVDCLLTEWPECPRPTSKKNKETVDALKSKFDKGGCKEPALPRPCEIPEVYCKQGLCVFRHQRGEGAPPTQ